MTEKQKQAIARMKARIALLNARDSRANVNIIRKINRNIRKIESAGMES